MLGRDERREERSGEHRRDLRDGGVCVSVGTAACQETTVANKRDAKTAHLGAKVKGHMYTNKY